jgi:hypothetical protein
MMELSSTAHQWLSACPAGPDARSPVHVEPPDMNARTEQAPHFEELSSADFATLEVWDPTQVVVTPRMAARLWLQTSLRLTRAQKELHDAIFSHDGSEAALDRYASARAELDSAEAWALHVSRTLPRQRQD